MSPPFFYPLIVLMIDSILFFKIWVPIGNLGGANVNPLKPIPKDL